MTRNKLLRTKVELEERVDGQTDELAETGARLKGLIDGSLKGIYLHTAPRPGTSESRVRTHAGRRESREIPAF
jgi:hypothetical protein